MSRIPLTATELGISQDERDALVGTMNVLETEAIIFNMSITCSVQDRGNDEGAPTVPTPPCGTHACIGGTMSLLMQNGGTLPALVTPEMGDIAARFVWANEKDTPFSDLFFGNAEADVTPTEGHEAISRFLHGERPWL